MTYNGNAIQIVLLVVGAKGAVGTTTAVAVEAIKKDPELILPYLTTTHLLSDLISIGHTNIIFSGWDICEESLENAINRHRVLPEHLWRPYSSHLKDTTIMPISFTGKNLRSAVEGITNDIKNIKKKFPNAFPVMINLLPACGECKLPSCKNWEELLDRVDPLTIPDFAYIMSAISQQIPVVNFTSNYVEIPLICEEAIKKGVPISGRDGKTGQTYLKTVLASALKARSLLVEGWYSLNILGNQDGRNLAVPSKAVGKIANKTDLLDQILGYPVGRNFGESTHSVRIDYYAPRRDNKESWDVIDFSGLFGLPMSLRINLMARDSILGTPIIMDLAFWMVLLQKAGICGCVPELAFYYKRSIGSNPPLGFQQQVEKLDQLANLLRNKLK